MTNEKFKEIFEANQNDPMQLCWVVYNEEAKGFKIDAGTFEQLFSMFVMTTGGMNNVLERLKVKYNYK